MGSPFPFPMAADKPTDPHRMGSPYYLRDQEAIMDIDNLFRDVYQRAKDERSSPQLMTAVLQCREYVSRKFAKELRDRSQQQQHFPDIRLAQIEQEKNTMAKMIEEHRDQLSKQKTIIDQLTDQTAKQKNIIGELEEQLSVQRRATDEAQKELAKCQAINAEWMLDSEKSSKYFQDTTAQLENTVATYGKLLESQKKVIEELQLKNTSQILKYKESNARLEKTVENYSNLLLQQKQYIEDKEVQQKKLEEELEVQKKLAAEAKEAAAIAAVTVEPKVVNIPLSLPHLKTADCTICCTEFTATRSPMVAPCGHSLCQGCLPNLSSLNCPWCSRVDAFTTPVRNFLAFEIIEEWKRKREAWRKECQ